MTPPPEKKAPDAGATTSGAGDKDAAAGAQQSSKSTALATKRDYLYRATPPLAPAFEVAGWASRLTGADPGKDRIVVVSPGGVYVFVPGVDESVGDYLRDPASRDTYATPALWAVTAEYFGADLAVIESVRPDRISYWLGCVADHPADHLVAEGDRSSLKSILPTRGSGRIYLVTTERLGAFGPTPAPAEVVPDPHGTPQTAAWAESLTKVVRDAIEKLRRDDAANQPKDGSPPPKGSPSYSLPDAVYYLEHQGEWHVTVWVGRAQQTIPLRPGETDEQLVERVRAAAKNVRTTRDPSNSTKVRGSEKLPVSKVEGEGEIPLPPGITADPIGGRKATDPAFPARILSHGPEGAAGNLEFEHTVSGASVSFTMDLDYAKLASGFWQEFGMRWQIVDYRWELIDISGLDLAKVKGRLAGPTAADQEAQIKAIKDEAANEPDPAVKAQKEQEAKDLEDKLRASGPETDSGIARDLARNAANIWTDTKADLNNLVGNPAPLGELAVIGITDLVALGGSVIEAGISAVAAPTSDRKIAFKNKGLYLLRCFAQPVITDDDIRRIEEKGLKPIIRPPSVAILPVVVTPINERAQQINDAELTQIKKLEAQKDAPPFPLSKDDVAAQLADLTTGLTETNEQSIKRSQAKVAAERKNLTDWNELQAKMVEIDLRPSKLRLWKSMLDLRGIELGAYAKTLDETDKRLSDMLTRVTTGYAVEGVTGTMYRPRITLVSELDGAAHPILSNLAQTPDSKPGRRIWRLIDISSPETQQYYEGKGATHQAAIRMALQEFAEKSKYGRGTIAVRLATDVLKTDLHEDILVPPLLVSAPGDEDRAWARLKNLAIAAELAGLVISGPIGLGIGIAGGIIGGAVAIHNMQQRSQGGRLHLDDFETAMDILAVVGAVVGAASPALKGIQGAAEAAEMARLATRAKVGATALHVIGVGLLAGQVIIIPLGTYKALEAIQKAEDADRASSGGRPIDEGKYRAKRLETWLSFVKSGVVTARMIQMGANQDAGWNPMGDTIAKPPPTPAELRAKPAAEGLPADLKQKGVTVEYDADIGATRGVSVKYIRDDASGLVTKVIVKVGSHANAQDVQLHANTARALLRYSGLEGRVRVLLAQLMSKFGSTEPPLFSRAWEAKLELTKLKPIIADRMTELSTDGLDPVTREDLLTELSSLERQVSVHAKTLADMVLDPGTGSIDAKGVSKAQAAAKAEGLQDLPEGYHYRRKGLGWEIVDHGGVGKVLELDPVAKTWTEVAAPKTKTDPRFADDATAASAFADLGGTDTQREFGQWVDVVVNDLKLKTLAQLEAMVGNPAGKGYRTIRNRVKSDAMHDLILTTLRSAARLEQTQTFKDATAAGTPRADALRQASLVEMLRISQKLSVEDRGALGERWYRAEFAPSATRQVDALKASYPTLNMAEDRRIDMMDGGVLRELKNWTDRFGTKETTQFADLIKLLNSNVQVDGQSQTVNSVVITILSPKGAAANRAIIETTLKAHAGKPVAFEVFNAKGERMTITPETVSLLLDPMFSAWLGIPSPTKP